MNTNLEYIINACCLSAFLRHGNVISNHILSCLIFSGDSTLLRLPAATETPFSAYCFAPAAGLHAS